MLNPTQPAVSAPLGPITYSQWYTLPGNDPFRADYRTVLASFDPDNANIARSLLEQVLGSTSIPQAFAVVCNAESYLKVYILHRPARYMAQIGVPPTPWDNRIFATNGEVTGSLSITVQFPDDPFRLTSTVRVRSIDQIDEFFSTNPAAELLDVTPPELPNSMELRTRHMMYLPAKYVSGLLNTQGITPRKMWETIMPQIRADNKLEECKILVNWMRAAVTLAHVRIPRSQPPREIQTVVVLKPNLIVPMLDANLYAQREEIINRDLTRRFPQQQTRMGEAIQQLARIMVSIFRCSTK